jgi:hypothetical protein
MEFREYGATIRRLQAANCRPYNADIIKKGCDSVGINRLSPHREEKPIPKGTFTKLKESIFMKNTPVEAGRFAFFSPLPMFFTTCLWSWTVFFGIYFGLLQMDIPIPGWLICITVLPPICCSPILWLLGIIHGILKRKEKRAWLGILLSAFCLVENALLFCAMGYLSRF